MEVAVTAVLAEHQLTARDVFGDWWILLGFKPNRRTASQAAGGGDDSFNGGKPCQLGTGACS